MSEPSAAPTPSFRGRGRGRGRSQAVRAHVARLAQARKAANGRRGRQKLYDHPKPQAASERLKELKAAFSAVANAARPALEDLADRSLHQLKSPSDAFRALREFHDVKAFLDARLRQVQAVNSNRLLLDTRLKDYIYQTSGAITREGFVRDIEDAKDRFVDAQLQRLDLLEQLHDNELPIEIVDSSWNFREISDERFRDVKAHVEYRTDLGTHPVYGNKVEVPCAKTVTGRRLAGALPSLGEDNALKPSPKRKADSEADVPPPPKRLIGSAPRHIGGLLSAVVAPTDEDEDDDAEAEAPGSPGRDSKLPSPSPALAEEEEEMLEDDENGTPAGDDDDAVRVRPSDRLPPLPNGASEPDAYGVRLINKRRTANFDVYNRILVPSLFEFEPHEIGFRDSTNDKSRGATKIKRGRFLDTPNSNTMHFDRSLWQYDATTYEDGDLDEELIKKHNLHPKYGLFLRTSTNDMEPPKPRVTGHNPVVFYTPRGRTFNSSRSITIARLEDGAVVATKKPAMAAAVEEFAEQEGVKPADLQPPQELVDEFRAAKSKLWLGPRRITRDETEELEDPADDAMPDYGVATPDEDQKLALSDQEEAPEDDSGEDADRVRGAFAALLDAAVSVGAEADNTSCPVPQPQAAGPAPSASPPAPPSRRATSRPFDPVRDVFMDRPSADDRTGRRQSTSTDYFPPATAESSQAYTDASSLLYMANLASDREYIPSFHQQQQQQQQQQHQPSYRHQQQPQPGRMQYPPSRGASYDYPPTEPSTASYSLPPAPPHRKMSMDPPQQATPQQHHQLLDPRLFGEASQQHHQQQQQQQQQLPPPDAGYNPNRDTGNGYGSNGYYQQPPQSYMHASGHQNAPLPPPGPSPTDPYGQPPLPSAAYGQPPPASLPHPSLPPLQAHGMVPRPPDASPSRAPSHFYMSPPSQPAPPPMMRPYDRRYGAPPSSSSQADHDGTMLPHPGSYGQQGRPMHRVPGLPPSYQEGPPLPSDHLPSHHLHQPHQPHQQQPMSSQSAALQEPASPRMYATQLPSYPHGSSREQQSHPYASNSTNYYSRGSPPPPQNGFHNGEYHRQQTLETSGGNGLSGLSNGNGSSNGSTATKYRPLHPPTGNEWHGADSDGSGFRGGPGSALDTASNNAFISADGQSATLPPAPVEASGPRAAAAPNTKELRTVPYDYEKIKDYVAIEPPPSHGPKAIRGWAHNNMKRGSISGGSSTANSRGSVSSTATANPAKGEATPPVWDSGKGEKQQQHQQQ